jgi:hypothetical protein
MELFEARFVYRNEGESGEGPMVMKIEEALQIENPRNHSAERVETLRQLLAGGARVEADPKRPNFYEVESGSDVYYIHISPVTGKILLLAAWPKAYVPGEEATVIEAA